MAEQYSIRQEAPKDYNAVESLIKESFANAAFRDGTEQQIAKRLRQSAYFVPELSLVACKDTELIGHILLTKMPSKEGLLVLAPLSVLPNFQGQGIGTMLVGEAHKIAQNMGFGAIHLVGYPLFYSRLGYKSGYPIKLNPPMDIPKDSFLFIELVQGFLSTVETISYPEEFGF